MPALNLPKWPALIILAIAELLGMAVWFSASAVVPALTDLWGLTAGQQAWLTMSVQIGFVVGTFLSALLNLPDRLPTRWLFALSSILAGAATALITLATGPLLVLVLRFLTGAFLVGVYPVGMKIMATWTREDRGLGIGLLVGALTLGSALPHLINALGNGMGQWQQVIRIAAGLAVSGGLLAAVFVDEGPFRTAAPPFDWQQAAAVLRQRDLRLANLGYLGHMWELYAMWAWTPLFILASFEAVGVSAQWAGIVAAAVIGIGGVGSLVAGQLADRVGRTTVSMASLVISGTCSLIVGLLFGRSPFALTVLVLIWGFAVVADSAQFSACISELCETEYTGTALTLQTGLGFLLTLLTIRIVPTLQAVVGWRWAFALLAVGPLIGIWAMASLRRSEGAVKLAGGRG